jgi:hypothetical protein
MKALFKKDSKGNVLIWIVNVVTIGFYTGIKVVHGLADGAKTINEFEVKAKNIGKANQTTREEQAEKEKESLILDKLKRGYKDLDDVLENSNIDVNEITTHSYYGGIVSNLIIFLLKDNLSDDVTDSSNNLKPMKAQQYYRSKKNWTDPDGKVWDDRKYYFLQNPYAKTTPKDVIIKFPCLIQPKINGIRCTISLNENQEVQILSKEGLSYDLFHIKEYFTNNKKKFYHSNYDEPIIFDGELYIHNTPLQVIQSAVKSNNMYTPSVMFIPFDLAIKNVTNIDRIGMMKDIFTQENEYPIHRITTYKIINNTKAQELTDRFIKEGYEGSILRNPKGFYGFGRRPMDMVKLKRVMDEEFIITDIIPQKKDESLGLYVCRTQQGVEFEVTPKGDETFKQIILVNKHLYIGKMLTCVFYEYTEKNIPFHIIDNIVRNYE